MSSSIEPATGHSTPPPMTPTDEPPWSWPIDPDCYDRSPALTTAERDALAVLDRDWQFRK